MERSDLLNSKQTTPKENLFYTGPGEYLIEAVKDELLKVEQFKALFGEFIDCYKREDYPVRALPAMRLYCERYTKEFESWFIEGDIKMDLIYPASLRRADLQSFPMTITSAVIQQFRRTPFFNAVDKKVPGLNELGKRVDVDASLGFQWQDNVVPLTQVTLNFKIDLRIWDDYLSATNRTKEEPFCETIVDLKRIVSTIKALDDDDNTEVVTGTDQKV